MPLDRLDSVFMGWVVARPRAAGEGVPCGARHWGRAVDELSTAQLTSIEAELRRRRAELTDLMASHEEESRPVELEQSGQGRLARMDALQVQAMAVETDRRRHLELNRIDAALARLAAGDYGDCAQCGEPIAVKRLLNDPATPLCIDCASRGETRPAGEG
jgi:DnaK suppressor protein